MARAKLWDGEKWIKPPEHYCSECKKFIDSAWYYICNRCAKRLSKEREKNEQRHNKKVD